MSTLSTLAYHGRMSQPAATGARERYHHGSLQHALLVAGMELAREGGPDAVVLREATRRVGVSPNAAYRHFADRDALLNAVSVAAQAELAAAYRGGVRPDRAEPGACGHRPGASAGDRHGVCALRAPTIPGCSARRSRCRLGSQQAGNPSAAGPKGRTAFELLTWSLDEYVAAGLMPPAPARRGGVPRLVVGARALDAADRRGRSACCPRAQADAVTQQVVDMVEAGFTAP